MHAALERYLRYKVSAQADHVAPPLTHTSGPGSGLMDKLKQLGNKWFKFGG